MATVALPRSRGLSLFGDDQTLCSVRSKSFKSTSMDRASLDNTTSAANTPSVTIAVMSGKRQKSQSIVPADTVMMARNATMAIRADEDALIPVPLSNANPAL
jgi:hypothetical protein